MKFCFPGRECARRDRRAHLGHDLLKVMNVVPAEQHARDHLIAAIDVMQIGA